jgi:MazG family protein
VVHLPAHRRRPPDPLTGRPESQPSAAESAAAARSAEAIARLDEITRLLRRECPWDREQDERSIVPHTVEEAYELADAAAAGDDAKLRDELGDVLFQVHFLSLLLEERGAGAMADVADGMSDKLVRRHPHVFGETEASDAAEVLGNWDRIKRDREGRDGLFTDVPENLPALLHARKLQRRAANRAPDDAELGVVGGAGTAETILEASRLLDELGRLAADGAEGSPTAPDSDRAALETALGDLLFAVVDVARRLRVDPELALRAASSRFRSAAGDGE